MSRQQEIAARVAELTTPQVPADQAQAQEAAERQQISTLANDPYNVAMGQINHVLLPQAVADGAVMQEQAEVFDAPSSPGGGAYLSGESGSIALQG